MLKLFKLLIFLQVFSVLSAQQKTCFVEYKIYSDPTNNYKQWFDNEKLIFNLHKTYKGIEFTVRENGVLTYKSDTIKYNKEYHEYVKEYKKDMEKDPIHTNQRYYNSNVLKRSGPLDNVNYLVVDTLPIIPDWEIQEDTLNVLGYTCQKATTTFRGTLYTAYFTTKLPFNAGPKNFRGLPGLILRVHNDKQTLGFEAIEIQYPFTGIVPKLDETGKVVSQIQYTRLTEEYNNNTLKNLFNLMNSIPKKEN